MRSEAESLAFLPETEKQRILDSLSDEQAAQLAFDWTFWGRPKQMMPAGEAWRIWLIMTGRGWGKTLTGAETTRYVAENKLADYIALVAPTAGDARDVMVEGETGILSISPPWNRPTYEPSKRRLTWKNGVKATLFSADEPDRLRGPQHGFAWCDEVSSWKYPEAWDMLMFGMRLGNNPRVVVTTTPKPNKLTKTIINTTGTIVTRGSTYENKANLAPQYVDQIIKKYEGTRLGRQELYGELLSDIEGALWNYSLIEACRDNQQVDFKRIVVAIDPAVTSEEGSDETGIIVAGIDNAGKAYVIDDLSVKASPNEWARRAIAAYHKYKADRIVAEVNQGGDMVESIIRHIDPAISYRAVHAAKGKYTRAEPVAALYEQGRVKHRGSFPVLEDQLCNWVQGESSPDRLDALVWAVTDLCLSSNTPQTGVITINRKW